MQMLFKGGCKRMPARAVAKCPEIEIISYLVRDRVIPLEEITVRSVMIVGFRFSPRIDPALAPD